MWFLTQLFLSSHKKNESKEMKWPAVSSVSLCACTFPGEHSPGTQFESGHGRDALNEEMGSWQMRRCCPISWQLWSGSELAERIHWNRCVLQICVSECNIADSFTMENCSNYNLYVQPLWRMDRKYECSTSLHLCYYASCVCLPHVLMC